jgi:hypothetical protein
VGMPVNTLRTWGLGVFELDAPSRELPRSGAVVWLREQRARILLLLSRCTALTLFGSQTTPLRANVRIRIQQLTAESSACSVAFWYKTATLPFRTTQKQ